MHPDNMHPAQKARLATVFCLAQGNSSGLPVFFTPADIAQMQILSPQACPCPLCHGLALAMYVAALDHETRPAMVNNVEGFHVFPSNRSPIPGPRDLQNAFFPDPEP